MSLLDQIVTIYAADGSDERRLRRMLDELLHRERERCAQIAEETTRQPMDYIDWSPGPAADDRALKIAALIRAAD